MFVKSLLKVAVALFSRSLDKVPTAFICPVKSADSDWVNQQIFLTDYMQNFSAKVQIKHVEMLQ